MDLKLPTDHFRSSLELEELSVAQKFGIEPEEWDKKPVPERERLIGAERDLREMEVIANMLIWIGLYILPVALILFFPVRWIWRWIKRQNTGRKEKKAQKTAVQEKSK